MHLQLLEEEKTELAQDRSRLLEKSKNDDSTSIYPTLFPHTLTIDSDLVSKYKEKIDSDSRQIRQLDIERNEAELSKNKLQVCLAHVAVLCISLRF